MTPLQLREALRLLLNTKFSNSRIAAIVAVAINTVRRYRTLLRDSEMSWLDITQMADDELNVRFSKSRRPASDKRLPDWAYVAKQMENRHQTLIQLWEEYRRAEPATAYCFSQFTHYYRLYKASVDIAMRQTHYAGERCFVDFAGKTISWFNSVTGKTDKAQIFVSALGYSRLIFACACASQSTDDFIQAHQAMLDFYGGVPLAIVPDNLKAAVIQPGSTPVLNRAYLDFAQHYGLVIEPARVRRPQDKSLAEVSVLLVTRWITVVLRRRSFFSINEINHAIAELLPALNNRPFKRMPGSRQSRFEEAERQALRPLPAEPYQPATWIAAQKVPSDYHVYFLGHAYSVPYRLVGEKVEARITATSVEILHKGVRVTTHIRSSMVGGHTTSDIHRPASHRAYATQCLEHYQAWAKQQGTATLQMVLAQFEGKPEYSTVASKACSELQHLARTYGQHRLEAACHCATDIQSLTVKSVRSILQCKLDEREDSNVPVQGILPLHHNVRGAAYFQQGGL